MQKPGTPGSMPSKSAIFAWIKQIVPEASSKMKVQDLGDGVIYCKIMNHYYPGSINLNRLNSNPKNQYDFSLNLKMFQNALTVHKVNVPFDVGKIAKQKFLQNWGLVNSLYRQLSSNNDDLSVVDDSKSVSYAGSKFTPKRSFEMAFSHEQHHKLIESQTYVKPTYVPPREPTVHYQNSQVYTPPVAQINVQPSITPQNQIQSKNMTNIHANHTSHQQSGSNHGASTIYNHSGINQNAFGGFNFGMSNSLSAINFSANQNFSFNRPQNPTSRDTLNSIINKPSNFDQPISNKCWSVGKIPTREPLNIYGNQTQQNSGKYSVNSHIFQNNYNAVIDRVKEILLKNSHDIQKIRQIKILLNIPLNEDIVKIQEEQNVMINCTNINKPPKQSLNSDKKIKTVESKICTKQTIEGSKQNIELPQEKQNKQVVGSQEKASQGSKSLSNTGLNSENEVKNQRITSAVKNHQNSGKKIRNNFFGQGSMFRK